MTIPYSAGEDIMTKKILLLTGLLLVLFLTGCSFKSGEDLYALPQASAEYDSLQTCLQSILKEGLEYSAPLTGSNTQSVQLVDLDNDGQDEAIAFFRDSSVDSQSLKIYVFRKSDENTYAPALIIEGNGTAINSAVSCQLEGGKQSMCELLISWQLSTTVYSLSAYSLNNYSLSEMMSSSTYTKYAVDDLNQDGNEEISWIAPIRAATMRNTILLPMVRWCQPTPSRCPKRWGRWKRSTTVPFPATFPLYM